MELTINTSYRSHPDCYNNRIRFLVLHFTAETFETSMKYLLGNDPQHQVSVHYLVGEKQRPDGIIYQLVSEEKRAWHAGDSSWRGHTEVNDSSVGIENVNLDGNKHEFANEQIEALIFLCHQIIERYDIQPYNVVGHEDIAPGRKVDPGKLFPWKRLYDHGIGAWAEEEEVAEFKGVEVPDGKTLGEKLRGYGYEVPLDNPQDKVMEALQSFRRHFCPEYLDLPIESNSYAVLLALLKKYGAVSLNSYLWRPSTS